MNAPRCLALTLIAMAAITCWLAAHYEDHTACNFALSSLIALNTGAFAMLWAHDKLNMALLSRSKIEDYLIALACIAYNVCLLAYRHHADSIRIVALLGLSLWATGNFLRQDSPPSVDAARDGTPTP